MTSRPTPPSGDPTTPVTPPPVRGDWRSMHLWQFQPVRDVLLIAGVLWLVHLGYLLSIVTVPMLLAIALAYLFEPVVRRAIRSRHISRPGVALGIIAFAAVIVVVPLTLGITFAAAQSFKLVQSLDRNVGLLRKAIEPGADDVAMTALPQGWQAVAARIRTENAEAAKRKAEGPEAAEKSTLTQAVDWGIQWVQANGEALSKQALGTGATAVGVVARGFFSVGKLIFQGLLTAFFFFYFCTGWGAVLEFWEGLIPDRKRSRVVDLAIKMDVVIAGFVRGRLTICAILAGFVIVAYWIIGVPVPLILGPVVGVLCLVPYASFLSVPLAAVAMWMDPAGALVHAWWWAIVGPLIVWLICQMLDDYVLNPAIQGQTTGLATPTILFSSIAGGVLGGFYGVLVAIPVGACIRILLREVFWPRVRAWVEGRASDALPISEGEKR
ncbi:MAG: AI-2E family transporter [Phycisphaeraceae bacterium]|nr:AI-2E family transporter [Phycisphaeraceae bacterium]